MARCRRASSSLDCSSPPLTLPLTSSDSSASPPRSAFCGGILLLCVGLLAFRSRAHRGTLKSRLRLTRCAAPRAAAARSALALRIRAALTAACSAKSAAPLAPRKVAARIAAVRRVLRGRFPEPRAAEPLPCAPAAAGPPRSESLGMFNTQSLRDAARR